jgi:tetratricopeptide (TPR) repeat protein
MDKAIEYYTRALDISKKLELNYRISTILSNLGNVYAIKGDLDKAIEIQQESLEIRKLMGNKREISTSLINVGVVYQLKGDIDQALDCYEESLQLSEESETKSNIALALNNIGNIYELKGDPKFALDYFEKSLKLYIELGIKEKIALLHSNIGSINRIIGNTEEAIKNFNQSLSIHEEIGYNLGSAMVLFELIQEAIVDNDQELIQEYLKRLEQINKTTKIRSIEQRYRLANALVLKTSEKTRDQTKAIVLFEQVIEDEIVDHSLTVKAMVNLCDLLIKELTKTADIELLEEIKNLVQNLHNIAEDQSSNSILAEIYRLEALLALAELDMKKSRLLLKKGIVLAEEKGLESIASNIREEQKELEEQINLWEELQKRKAPLKETLQYVKIEKSMKQLQQEENLTYKKLFSLKI